MGRRGFTLVEVAMALVILAVVLLATSQLTTNMVHTVATSRQQDAAVELAQSRVAQIQADPSYIRLEATYIATESNFPTLPGFSRTTQIVHVGGIGLPQDYKKVTVTVTGPGLLGPVARSVTVAAP